MGRSPCCSKDGLNRGAWTAVEDKILTSYIKAHGEGKWRGLPKRAGLKRCGKSCRLRWLNYLRPDIKRGNISDDEEELIIRLHNLLGNRWSLIAGRLPGRTDNEIKNFWNTTLGKKVHSQSQSTHHLPRPVNTTKSKGKFPAMKESPVVTTAPSENQPAEPNLLVRTKASRCTKVLIVSQDQNLISSPPNTTHQIQDAGMKTRGDRDREYIDSDEFKLDFDMAVDGHPIETSFFNGMGDHGIFEDHEGGTMVKVDSNHSLSAAASSNDDDFMFHESMLDDWLGNDYLQPNVISDLQSLASFLGSEEEWLS